MDNQRLYRAIAGFVLLSVLPGFLGLMARPAFAMVFYVSTDGSDTNPGDEAAPFATLQRARDAVREIKKKGPLTEPIEIVLREGEYFLSETLVLTPEDSGAEACPITWRAAKGEKVVLSGGTRIAGPWSTDDHKTWYVDVHGAAHRGGTSKRGAPVRTIDYASAKITGKWTTSSYSGPTYLHDGNEDKGAKSVRFSIRVVKPGKYQVTLSNVPLNNRSARVPVTVASTDGEKTVTVDQRTDQLIEVGVFWFDPSTPATVTISTEGATDGYVIADTVCLAAVEPSLDATVAEQPEGWNFRQLFVDSRRAIRRTLSELRRGEPVLVCDWRFDGSCAAC